MRSALLALLALTTVACGDSTPPPTTPPSDAGACAYQAPARNDRIHLGCGGPAGEEGAEACARRLAAQFPGARLFVAPRAPCNVDLLCPTCAPLCTLAATGGASCTAGEGCPYTFSEGYAVVVEVGGRRALAAVAGGENCASTAAGRNAWGRINYADLESAARCARSQPDGGLGPTRFGGCPTVGSACGNVRGDTCQEITLRTMTGSYTASICTKECGGDSECGPNGVCSNGLCLWRCGGECATSCAENFTCSIEDGETSGVCLPLPPRR